MSVSLIFDKFMLGCLPRSRVVLSSLRVPSARMGGLEEGFKIISNHPSEQWGELTS